ncbi:MAG: DUF3108 domain-containing protein [Puniceicoccaceae bacterium]
MKLRPLLLLFVSAVCAGAPPADEPLKPRFRPGEALRYDLKWSVFKVGSARLQVHDLVEFEGEKAWHFSFHVRTNSFADAFFKVRTRIDTWVSEDLSRTLFYKEKKREGKIKRDIEVTFDWETRQATYANHGKKREPIDLPEGPVLDSVGAVYRFRSLPLARGESVSFAVTDGKKAVRLALPVDREARIKVKAGRFNTYRIEPETGELGGVFEKSDDSEVRIWFSSDRFTYPVQVQGEVVVGSFWAKLRAIGIRNPEELD